MRQPRGSEYSAYHCVGDLRARQLARSGVLCRHIDRLWDGWCRGAEQSRKRTHRRQRRGESELAPRVRRILFVTVQPCSRSYDLGMSAVVWLSGSRTAQGLLLPPQGASPSYQLSSRIGTLIRNRSTSQDLEAARKHYKAALQHASQHSSVAGKQQLLSKRLFRNLCGRMIPDRDPNHRDGSRWRCETALGCESPLLLSSDLG